MQQNTSNSTLKELSIPFRAEIWSLQVRILLPKGPHKQHHNLIFFEVSERTLVFCKGPNNFKQYMVSTIFHILDSLKQLKHPPKVITLKIGSHTQVLFCIKNNKKVQNEAESLGNHKRCIFF